MENMLLTPSFFSPHSSAQTSSWLPAPIPGIWVGIFLPKTSEAMSKLRRKVQKDNRDIWEALSPVVVWSPTEFKWKTLLPVWYTFIFFSLPWLLCFLPPFLRFHPHPHKVNWFDQVLTCLHYQKLESKHSSLGSSGETRGSFLPVSPKESNAISQFLESFQFLTVVNGCIVRMWVSPAAVTHAFSSWRMNRSTALWHPGTWGCGYAVILIPSSALPLFCFWIKCYIG